MIGAGASGGAGEEIVFTVNSVSDLRGAGVQVGITIIPGIGGTIEGSISSSLGAGVGLNVGAGANINAHVYATYTFAEQVGEGVSAASAIASANGSLTPEQVQSMKDTLQLQNIEIPNYSNNIKKE